MGGKDDLLAALDRSIAADQKLKVQAQDVVETANEAESLATATRKIVDSWDDDSRISSTQLDRLTKAWSTHAHEAERVSIEIQVSATPLSTATTSLVTTMTPRMLSSWVGPAAQKAAEDLRAMLNRPSLFDEVCTAMINVGLNMTRPGTRSSLECLRTAHKSLKRPASGTPDPSAVLLGARESITCALADLVQRVPHQRRAKSYTAKVELLGEQCGRVVLSSDQFETLGGTASALLKDLSSKGKQARTDTAEVHRLFDATLYFLKALCEGLDPAKLR